MRTNLEKVSLKNDFFSIRLFCNNLSHAWGNVLQGTGQNALNDLSCNRLPRVSFRAGLPYSSEIVLHSNASKYRKIWRTRLRAFLRMVGEYGHQVISMNQNKIYFSERIRQ